jgi:hypothetical protein
MINFSPFLKTLVADRRRDLETSARRMRRRQRSEVRESSSE